MDGRRKRGMATLVLVVLGLPLLVVCSLSFSGPDRQTPAAGGQPSRSADLTVGGTVGFAAAARNTYLEHRDAQRREIEAHRLFFYRKAGRCLQNR